MVCYGIPGPRPKYEVIDLLMRRKRQLQTLIEGSYVTIGFSSCTQNACNNGGSCSDHIVVHEDARNTDSQSLILTSPKVTLEVKCKCNEGFTGGRCEKKQDPCSPNPCQLVCFGFKTECSKFSTLRLNLT